ncbi:MAG: SDR family oxidoreductase [Paracoccus sp. (in: a-proteobacteria)]|nr:SDR family oxidoreductase [Paracoccus sp. (in: a-proteobacteria)]
MSRTLFITGASSGIGRATARAAHEAGWNVALFARSADRLAALAQELGARALALSGDATRIEDLLDAADKTARHFGTVDAAFANAGRGLSKPGTEAGDLDDITGMVTLNVMGVILTARALLPHLRKTQGTLVLTGSAAGRSHIKGSIYGATKWFVHGYGGNLAEEMRDWGGRCTVIAPGMVDTPFFAQGAPGKLRPEDIARSVLHAIEAPPTAALREIFVMPQG